MIPRKIHFIWLGGRLPEKYQFFISSWLKAHPQWEIKIWTDEDALTFPMKRRNIFESAPNWGAKSDVFRYEILYRLGGIYIDTDFLCVRNIDNLLNYSFVCGWSSLVKNEINNALIGSEPKHPVLEELMSRIKAPSQGVGSEATFEATGPKFFTQIVLDYVQNNPRGANILSHEAFYPMPNTFSRVREPPWKQFITEQTYAVHFWEYSWQKRTFFDKIRKPVLSLIPPSLKKLIKNFLRGNK